MKTHKQFWVWAYQAEADYLTAQAHAGWRFERRRALTYQFTRTSPLPGVVAIDYQLTQDDGDYSALMAAAGWQLWARDASLGGHWYYWYHPDPGARIYSDRASLAQLLRRLRMRWSWFGAAMVIFELALALLNHRSWLNWLIFGVIVVALGATYAYNAWALTRQIQRLNGGEPC